MKKIVRDKLTALITAALLLPLQLTSTAHAASHSVEVSLPAFPVQINGLTINSAQAQYPPIVYKDVTYLPLTWAYTRSLALEYTWSDAEGLHVHATGNIYQEPPAADLMGSNKKSSYVAEIVTYPVYVNDKPVDNEAETYPLLSFRDMTYFPMTWHFMHDEFAMNLFWNPTDGFAVVSPQRHYFFSFIKDDADYLYMYSGSQMFKIRKSLTEQPSLLTDEEQMDISAMPPPQADADPLPAAGFQDADAPSIVRKDKDFFYKDQKLLSLTPTDPAGAAAANGFQDDSTNATLNKAYTEKWLDLGEGRKVISFVESDHMNQILPEISTYYRYFFTDHGGRFIPVNGFGHWLISYKQQNADGSWWLASRPYISDTIHGRDAFRTGELTLLQPDGQSVSLNRQLNVNEIQVLSRQEDGSLIFRAYTRTLEYENPAFGIYKIDTSGKLSKLADLYGQAYVDSSGGVWVTDRFINRIVNISNNVSKLWMDYEFPFQS